MQVLTILIFFVAGVFTWTFLEYFLHRYLGHWKNGKNDFTKEHLRHHRETHYFAPAYKKAMAALFVLSALTLLLRFFIGWTAGFSFSLGLSMMYVVYEILHKRAHTHAPIGVYGRWLRKHHFYHHFKNPRMNHGVTSPLWDIVFGTNVNPDVVKVPTKLALKWLLDPVTGELLPQFNRDYQLRSGTTAQVV